jgi:hypothetical protein
VHYVVAFLLCNFRDREQMMLFTFSSNCFCVRCELSLYGVLPVLLFCCCTFIVLLLATSDVVVFSVGPPRFGVSWGGVEG